MTYRCERTPEWYQQAEAYIKAAYGKHPVNEEQDADLEFSVKDDGAFVTVRIFVSREEAGI